MRRNQALDVQGKKPSKTPLPFPAGGGGTRVSGAVGDVWGRTMGNEQLSAKVENEPLCWFIRGEYFTRATESVHYLGEQFCSNRALVWFYFTPVKRRLLLWKDTSPSSRHRDAHGPQIPSLSKGQSPAHSMWARVTIMHLDTWVMPEPNREEKQTRQRNPASPLMAYSGASCYVCWS